jgi:hypothetical protein
MPVNGSKPGEDIAELVQALPPLGDEMGTPFSDDSIFGDFDDGKVFDFDRWSAKDFDEMLERDGQAKSIESALTLPVRRTPWDVEPAEGDTGQAEEIKKILTTPANAGGMSIPMGHIIGQATSAFTLRKAFFEKVYKIGTGDLDGKVMFDKVAWRPASTCQLAREAKHGGFAGFRQRPRNFVMDSTEKVEDLLWINVPAERSWVYIHGQHRDPLRGYSDMEIALWAYRTKQKLRYLWYTFLEGQALPKGIVRAKDPADAIKTAKQARYLKNSGFIAVPDGVSMDMWASDGKGAEQFMQAIRFLDGEMSGSVLAGFTDLTAAASEGHGSYALSKDSSDFFLQSRQAVLEELEESVNHYLISDLTRWNYGYDAPCPRFKFGQIAEASIDEALTMLTAMAASTANNLPGEFVYMLAAKVGEYLDLDVAALEKAFEEHAKEKEEQAKAMAEQMNNPAMAVAVQKGSVKPEVARHMAKNAGQVGKATGAVDKATRVMSKAKAGASLSEYQRERKIIDLAGRILEREHADQEITVYVSQEGFESLPAAALVDDEGGTAQVVQLASGEQRELLLAAVDGHHVPGTAYHWFHEWRPRYAAVAIKYRKGKKLIEKLQAEGKIHPVEPDWYQGLKPGEKTTKKIGEGKGTKDEPIKIGLKPISGGDEGGTKLPFEGKGQTSKPARKVIKEAEEHFGKKGDPDAPTPAEKLAAAKKAREQEELDKVLASAQAKVVAKLEQKEQKAHASAKSLLADGSVTEAELKDLIDGIPDTAVPSMIAKKKGYKKALAEHQESQAKIDEHKAAEAAKPSQHGSLTDATKDAKAKALTLNKSVVIIKNKQGAYQVLPAGNDKEAKAVLDGAQAYEGYKPIAHFTGEGDFHGYKSTLGGSFTPTKTAQPDEKPKPKAAAPASAGKSWKTKNAAINNAKKQAEAEQVNYFAYKGADGNWHITKDKTKVDHHGGQPAQVAKPWGSVQPFDPGYDAKAAGAYTGPGASSGLAYPKGKQMPKGEHTGKGEPGDVGVYQTNLLPPVDPSGSPHPDETLWGSNGQIKLINGWWSDHEKKLSSVQRAAIEHYTGSGYVPMNRYVRGQDGASETTRQAVKRLDGAMQPLPTTVQVERGINDTSFWPDGNLVGETVRDLGYGSTSMVKPFGKPIILHLTVPEGIKAIPVEEMSSNKGENELLLQRGVGYKIVGDVIDSNGKRHITAVVVPPPDPDPYDVMG